MCESKATMTGLHPMDSTGHQSDGTLPHWTTGNEVYLHKDGLPHGPF